MTCEHLAVLRNAPLAALVVEAADAGESTGVKFDTQLGKRQEPLTHFHEEQQQNSADGRRFYIELSLFVIVIGMC